MQTTSALYQSILAGDHRVEVKVNINGVDYGIDKITSVQTSRAAFGTGRPVLGLASAGEISLSLYAESGLIPRMAEMKPYVRLVNESRQQSEWIPKGTFYIDTRKTDSNGLLELTGFDAMLKAERTQPWSELSWPARDIDAVGEIAEIMGLTVDAKTTSLMTSAFSIPMPVNYTMRETLQYIAALYGGSFIVSDRNTLQLVCLWDRAASADVTIGTSCRRLSNAPALAACTGVKLVKEDGTEYTAGTTSGYVYEAKSPWATQAAANALLARMSGFVYRPFAAEGAIINPAAEIGDTISENNLLSSLFSCDINFDSMCAANIEAPGYEELDHEYPYESSENRVFNRKMNNFQSELTLQAQAIAAKVSRVGGDAHTFGWYLDADHFSLASNGQTVMYVDDEGLTVNGTVNATAGNIGGCTIQNGTLHVENANIDNLNAGKITSGTLPTGRIGLQSITGAKIADETLASGHLIDGAAVNRVIGNSAVSYSKTSFQGTLDQVGTNTANIDTLYGYFTGSAHFQNCQIDGIFMFAGKYIGTTTKTVDGRTLYYLEWRDP
ncbi:MAG: hypothetical protein IKS55_15430 [Oscillospiraceae bacterium]|nr:hypothetical protein [Oscillospiraceae bacterium]